MTGPATHVKKSVGSPLSRTSVLVLASFLLLGGLSLDAAVAGTDGPAVPNWRKDTKEQHDACMAWWRDARLGMFIHWGPPAIYGGYYKGKRSRIGDFVQLIEKIPLKEYRETVGTFNPVDFDADAWAATAKMAGLRYVVLTAKHVDGFCLWPTKLTDFSFQGLTPFKRDVVGELQAACRKQGLRFGVYYSQCWDWSQPGGHVPASFGGPYDPAQKGDHDKFLNEFSVRQVGELLGNYPGLDVLWFDVPDTMNPQRAKPFLKLLEAHPNLIVNNRLWYGFSGDFETPEQTVPVIGFPGKDWETCMTASNGPWFFDRDSARRPAAVLIQKMLDAVSKGGNFLLNVGPDASGRIVPQDAEPLRAVGEWLKKNGEAIYGTQAGPFDYLSWGHSTRKGNRLYLIVSKWPKDGRLAVPMRANIKSVRLLAAPDVEVPVEAGNGRVVLRVPEAAPDPVASVIAVELDGAPVVEPSPTRTAKVTASSSVPDYPPENTVDRKYQTRWIAGSAGDSWLEFDCGGPVAVSGFGLDENFDTHAQKFRIEFEKDGQWQPAYEGTTKGQGARGSFPAVTSGKFRLMIVSPSAPATVSEFQLFRPE